MPGILDRMACGVALALALWGRVTCRRTPEAKKRLFFEEYAVKNGPWEGSVWGKGREPKKAEHQGEIFSDFFDNF